MVIGVDCGATNLRVGIFDKEGHLLALQKIASPLRTCEAGSQDLATCKEQVLKTNSGRFAKIVKEQLTALTANRQGDEIVALGVATPGPLDLEQGLLLSSSNLGNSGPINLKAQFAEEFSAPVFFDRDTNAALLGEAWQGAAVGRQNVVMLTLGSGVGGAIMVEGRLDRGTSGRAGEIGHIFMQVSDQNDNLPRCGLGHKGCLEALVNSARSMDELSTYLGYGLVNIANIFNPEMIIIGGGKISMGDFLPKAVEIMKSKGVSSVVDGVEVAYAKLKDESGIYGAAYLASQGIKNLKFKI